MIAASNILVRLPNWVGDAVMATSFLRAVRAGKPAAKITVALRPKLAEILAGSPFVDHTLRLPAESLGESIALGLRWRGVFDLAFVLPNSFRSALLPWFARARVRIGYGGQGRGWLLTVSLTPPRGEGRRRLPEPMPHYWRRLLDAVAIPWRGDRPELAVDEALRDRALAAAQALGVEEGERLVGLSPGAAFGPSKLWIPERFSEVASRLHAATGLRAILFIAPGEEALGRQVLAASRSPIVSTVDDPLPLSLLTAFMDRCALLVTTDSGTRHVGVARGVPTVTIMGPTDPRYTAFCLENQAVISREDVDCLGCHHKVCPIDHRCMAWITAEEVAERALGLLRAGK